MNDNHDTKPIDPVSPDDACPQCGERECDELALDIRFSNAEGVAARRGRQRRPGCQGLAENG